MAENRTVLYFVSANVDHSEVHFLDIILKKHV